MKKLILFILINLTICLYAGNTFSELPNGATVEVEFYSNGCFHDKTNTLLIKNKLGKITAELKESTTVPKNSFTLTEVDLTSLDINLNYYRTYELKNICTTMDIIEYKWDIPGKENIKEKFTDYSCSYESTNMSFQSLINELIKLDPPNKSLNQDATTVAPIS